MSHREPSYPASSAGLKPRFELKYRLDVFTYLEIRNFLTIYMKKDLFTLSGGYKGYLVRSLYFDTNDYRSYHEKMNGNNERMKFRIRTYRSVMGPDTPLKVELKARKSSLVEKRSVLISPDEYCYFLDHHHWKDPRDPVLLEFETSFHTRGLLPVIVTGYFREGYESRTGGDFRLTFDHEVQSAHADCLFPEHAFFRYHHPGVVVLEVKFRNEPPGWIRRMVRQYGLKAIANSKFTQGLQVARQDLHYPDGVVVVR